MAILLLLVLAACGGSGTSSPEAMIAETSEQAAGVLGPSATQGGANAERRLIRTASVRLQVDDVDLATSAADSLARAEGGFVAGSSLSEDGRGRRSASLTVRVPSAVFESTLEGLGQLGHVRYVSTGTEDVTKAYFDLETRLAVKEETTQRLRELGRRAGDLSDVLEVERELGRVVEEVEQLKGERRYYDERLAFSTINVTLLAEGAIRAPGPPPLADALSSSLEAMRSFFVWLMFAIVFFAPWFALVALGWLAVRAIRRRRRVRSN
jgi:Domain of unknown function (DUF4349)